MKTLVMAALACLAACKDKTKKEAPKDQQSFAQAMQIICTAHTAPEAENANPAERQRVLSEHIKENVTNPDAIIVFESVGVAAPAERSRLLDEAAKKAGLDGCAMIEAIDPIRRLPIPEIAGGRLEPFGEAPLMVISDSVIVIEGEQLEMKDVERFAAAVQEATKTRTIAVAADPATPFDRLFEGVHALVKGGAAPVLLARGPAGVGALPIDVPEKKGVAPVMPAEEAEPLGMVVAVTKDQMIVWSISQLEGTLKEPLAHMPLGELSALGATLTEVVERRWKGATRSAEDERIVLMFDGATPASTVAAVMANVRPTFPRVTWSAGFE